MKFKIENLSKSFLLNNREIKIIDGINLTINSGEFIALLGPSGCGKSTLLSLLAGYYPPDSGHIKLEGNLGFMPQQDMLLPWLNIIDNALLPLFKADKAKLNAARKQIDELLPLFGLEDFGLSLPEQLSGGMRQRAALLRTAMMSGDLWLLDEPFAKLDALTRIKMQDWLLKIIAELKPAVLFVSHDIDEAIKLADKIHLLSHRPAKINGSWQIDKCNNQAEKVKNEIMQLLS